MRKRYFCAVLALVLVFALSATLVACNKGGDDDSSVKLVKGEKSIVYLGDSIAEALIGPSPLEGREDYGYYALLGRINNFNYYNHSVSGHKTSGAINGAAGDGLLEIVNRETEGAELLLTHIKQADIIHVSILGNNFLQNDMGAMMIEIAESDDGQTSATMNHIIAGVRQEVDGVFHYYTNPVEDICGIVDRLKELNPDATIFFQNVYNPVFGNTTLINQQARQKLAGIVDEKGNFGPAGAAITTIEQYRALAEIMLNKLNGVLATVLEKEGYEDAFYVLDAHSEFNAVADSDTVNGYSDQSKGRALIFGDYTHPSDYGHAILAELTQKKLIELNLASGTASLQAWRNIRTEQLESMYSSLAGFDAAAAKAALASADSYRAVTEAYFSAVSGFTPVY